jgi:nitrogen fixation protein NifZ
VWIIMSIRGYEIGDLVFSRTDIHNDGGVPDVDEAALLAAAGARGVVVRAGSAQARPGLRIYLVRFEGPDQVLGPPVGCLDEELTQDESVLRADGSTHGPSSADDPP